MYVKSKSTQLERGNILVSVENLNSHLANQTEFWLVNSFSDRSLESFPTTQSKNITHDLLFLLISEVCCLCSRPASLLHAEVLIKLQLMRDCSLDRSPLPPQLSWSLARACQSVFKNGAEPRGSISRLLTLTRSRKQADVLAAAEIVHEQNLCASGSRPRSPQDQVCPASHYLEFVCFLPTENKGNLETPSQN